LKALPYEIEREAGPIIVALVAAGWDIHDARYAPEQFGNWWVDMVREGVGIRLVKDRSQYSVDGPAEKLKAWGLWKSFDDRADFVSAVTRFAEGGFNRRSDLI